MLTVGTYTYHEEKMFSKLIWNTTVILNNLEVSSTKAINTWRVSIFPWKRNLFTHRLLYPGYFQILDKEQHFRVSFLSGEYKHKPIYIIMVSLRSLDVLCISQPWKWKITIKQASCLTKIAVNAFLCSSSLICHFHTGNPGILFPCNLVCKRSGSFEVKNYQNFVKILMKNISLH